MVAVLERPGIVDINASDVKASLEALKTHSFRRVEEVLKNSVAGAAFPGWFVTQHGLDATEWKKGPDGIFYIATTAIKITEKPTTINGEQYTDASVVFASVDPTTQNALRAEWIFPDKCLRYGYLSEARISNPNQEIAFYNSWPVNGMHHYWFDDPSLTGNGFSIRNEDGKVVVQHDTQDGTVSLVELPANLQNKKEGE